VRCVAGGGGSGESASDAPALGSAAAASLPTRRSRTPPRLAAVAGAAGAFADEAAAVPTAPAPAAAAPLRRRRAPPLAATAAAVTSPPPVVKRPAPRHGSDMRVRGETTADGRPKPDERTVAELARRRWCSDAAQAEQLLARLRNSTRFPYPTALGVIDWLCQTLPGDEEAVFEDGRSDSVAARAFRRHPQLLAFSADTLAARWASLLRPRAQGGLGLDLEAARKRVAAAPKLLNFLPQTLLARAELLQHLGARDGVNELCRHPDLASIGEPTLLAKVAWLQAQGLDPVIVLAKQVALLQLTPESMLPKLRFLRSVVGLSDPQIAHVAPVLGYSLAARLRPRFLFALHYGADTKTDLLSLMIFTDARFVSFVQRHAEPAALRAPAWGPAAPAPPATWSAEWYRTVVEGPAFEEWADTQEAERSSRSRKADTQALAR
jgi:hypothetical protein